MLCRLGHWLVYVCVSSVYRAPEPFMHTCMKEDHSSLWCSDLATDLCMCVCVCVCLPCAQAPQSLSCVHVCKKIIPAPNVVQTWPLTCVCVSPPCAQALLDFQETKGLQGHQAQRARSDLWSSVQDVELLIHTQCGGFPWNWYKVFCCRKYFAVFNKNTAYHLSLSKQAVCCFCFCFLSKLAVCCFSLFVTVPPFLGTCSSFLHRHRFRALHLNQLNFGWLWGMSRVHG